MTGLQAIHMASIRNRSAAAAAATIASASARLRVSGFSHSTCLPASKAIRAFSRWKACGVATYTTSTSGSATSASYDAWPRTASPYSRANASAASCEREPTAAISAPGTSRRLSAKLRAMRPVARMPQRVVSVMAETACRCPSVTGHRAPGHAEAE